MPFIAGAMVVGSALSYKSGKSNDKKMRREMAAQRMLQEKQLKFAQEQWGHYKETYGDLEKIMVADAMEGAKGDYQGVADRASADIESQFENQADRGRRRMESLGIDPSSGRYESSDRRAGLELAKGSAIAQNVVRNNEKARVDKETWQRRYGVGSFGANMINGAASNVQRSMNSMADAHGQSASTYGDLAGNLFSQAGQMGMYGAMQGGKFLNGKMQPKAGLEYDTPMAPPARDYGGGYSDSGFDGYGTSAVALNDTQYGRTGLNY